MSVPMLREHFAIFAGLLEEAGNDMLILEALADKVRDPQTGYVQIDALRIELAKLKAAQTDGDAPKIKLQ